MDELHIALTAIFLKANGEYVAFLEELPDVNATGRTIEEARAMLRHVATVIFDERRRESGSFLDGKDVVREALVMAFPASPDAEPFDRGSTGNSDEMPTVR